MIREPKGKFDFVEAALDGYRFAWRNREGLLHLAFMPFAVKFLTYLAIVFAGVQENYLRQGLVSLPSYFVEAWFIAAALRYVFLRESWPQFLTGDAQTDQGLIFKRRMAMHSAVAIYVLIKVISAAVLGIAMQTGALDPEAGQQAATAEGPIDWFFVALLGMAVAIWTFRYMWLYIPAALGYSVRDYLKAIRGFMGSFYLMGTWLICFAPAVIVLMIATEVMTAFFGGAQLDVEHLLYVVVWSLFQAVMELGIVLVASLAVAAGVHEVMEGSRFP